MLSGLKFNFSNDIIFLKEIFNRIVFYFQTKALRNVFISVSVRDRVDICSSFLCSSDFSTQSRFDRIRSACNSSLKQSMTLSALSNSSQAESRSFLTISYLKRKLANFLLALLALDFFL